MALEIYGMVFRVGNGTVVSPDGWRGGSAHLNPPVFDGAAFSVFGPNTGNTISMNVEITGRTLQHRNGGNWIRARIEFVNDGEPNTECGGWVLADTAK